MTDKKVLEGGEVEFDSDANPQPDSIVTEDETTTSPTETSLPTDEVGEIIENYIYQYDVFLRKKGKNDYDPNKLSHFIGCGTEIIDTNS